MADFFILIHPILAAVRLNLPAERQKGSKRRLGRDPTKPPHLLKCWVYQPNLRLLDMMVTLIAM